MIERCGKKWLIVHWTPTGNVPKEYDDDDEDSHSIASPLPLYILIIQLLHQSAGTLPSLTTALSRSIIHSMTISPAAFSIFVTTPDGPDAFPDFMSSKRGRNRKLPIKRSCWQSMIMSMA